MPAVSTKHSGPSGGVDHRVDGVAGGAGHVVDDRPVLADQAIEERRLPDVGPPHQGHPGPTPASSARRAAPGRVGRLGRRRQAGPPPVQQVAGPPPVDGAHRPGVADPQRDELPGRRLAARVVHLVHDQQHRRPGPSDHPGRRQVLVGHPDRHVDHEEHQVGLGHGPLGLVAHLGLEVAARRPATRRCRRGRRRRRSTRRRGPCGPGSPRAPPGPRPPGGRRSG